MPSLSWYVRNFNFSCSIPHIQDYCSKAAFIAAVQTQIIALSYNRHDTTLQNVTNYFGFAGLTFDIMGAGIGIIQSIVHQNIIQTPVVGVTTKPLKEKVQKLMEGVGSGVDPRGSHDCRQVAELLQTETMKRRMFWKSRQFSSYLPSDKDFLQHFHHWLLPQAKNRSQGAAFAVYKWAIYKMQTCARLTSYTPVMLMGLGIICLLTSVVCFAADTQASQATTIWLLCIIGASVLYSTPGPYLQAISSFGARIEMILCKSLHLAINFVSQNSEAHSVQQERREFSMLDRVARNLTG
jgi:hypothetical protein